MGEPWGTNKTQRWAVMVFDLMKVKRFFAVRDRSYSGAQGISP
jgi:hypothetical protein